jgi:hypothetical protein
MEDEVDDGGVLEGGENQRKSKIQKSALQTKKKKKKKNLADRPKMRDEDREARIAAESGLPDLPAVSDIVYPAMCDMVRRSNRRILAAMALGPCKQEKRVPHKSNQPFSLKKIH